jgi:hypothetical protein
LDAAFVETTLDARGHLYRLKSEPWQKMNAWLVLACTRRYNRDQATRTKTKTKSRQRGPGRERHKEGTS